jgi:hypothetical protein
MERLYNIKKTEIGKGNFSLIQRTIGSRFGLNGVSSYFSKYKGGNQTQKRYKKITKRRQFKNNRNTIHKQVRHNTTYRI